MSTFDPTDAETWPVVLTPEHIAAIYSRTVLAVKKAVQLGRFQPEPFEAKPYRWRRADVLRRIEGARGYLPLRKVG